MIDSKLRLEKFAKGTVWLVGTGPGDPGLITLYALYAIQKADVIIYDALVNPEILKLSRKLSLYTHLTLPTILLV